LCVPTLIQSDLVYIVVATNDKWHKIQDALFLWAFVWDHAKSTCHGRKCKM